MQQHKAATILAPAPGPESTFVFPALSHQGHLIRQGFGPNCLVDVTTCVDGTEMFSSLIAIWIQSIHLVLPNICVLVSIGFATGFAGSLYKNAEGGGLLGSFSILFTHKSDH